MILFVLVSCVWFFVIMVDIIKIIVIIEIRGRVLEFVFVVFLKNFLIVNLRVRGMMIICIMEIIRDMILILIYLFVNNKIRSGVIIGVKMVEIEVIVIVSVMFFWVKKIIMFDDVLFG